MSSKCDMRGYVARPISYRQGEDMVGERRLEVDHSTLHRQGVNM
jgi:transposase-like protein